LPIQELLSHLKPFIPPEWYKDTNYLEKVVMLDRERLKTLADARYLMEIFFKNPKVDKDLLCKKDDIEDIKKWLKRAKEILESIEFNHDSLDKSLRDLTEELGIKTAQLFYAIRIALTGRTEAPGLFDIMLTLGKQETIKRIENVN
jgi:glutamyl-tRNA synthetase